MYAYRHKLQPIPSADSGRNHGGQSVGLVVLGACLIDRPQSQQSEPSGCNFPTKGLPLSDADKATFCLSHPLGSDRQICWNQHPDDARHFHLTWILDGDSCSRTGGSVVAANLTLIPSRVAGGPPLCYQLIRQPSNGPLENGIFTTTLTACEPHFLPNNSPRTVSTLYHTYFSGSLRASIHDTDCLRLSVPISARDTCRFVEVN